jgi:hypothetical protein
MAQRSPCWEHFCSKVGHDYWLKQKQRAVSPLITLLPAHDLPTVKKPLDGGDQNWVCTPVWGVFCLCRKRISRRLDPQPLSYRGNMKVGAGPHPGRHKNKV